MPLRRAASAEDLHGAGAGGESPESASKAREAAPEVQMKRRASSSGADERRSSLRRGFTGLGGGAPPAVADGTATAVEQSPAVDVASGQPQAKLAPWGSWASPVAQNASSFSSSHTASSNLPGPVLPAESFEVPCVMMGTSGGTAKFFYVRYQPQFAPGGPNATDRFIGKDVARAECEVEFYHNLRMEASIVKEWADLANVALESPGVAFLPCKVDGQGEPKKRNLLLMENLHYGFDKLRLCDIKIGEETAVANWKGKSWLSALGNSFMDERTNSTAEGFRLEGMDQPPEALQARLSFITDESTRASYMRKKLLGDRQCQRFCLQRLQACDFLASWLDLSSLGPGYELRAHAAVWSSLQKLTNLVRALAALPWPQQWIGTSVGMGMEVGSKQADPQVFVKLFDWGRSDLYNEERYAKLERTRQKEVIRRWQQYIIACCRLHWEVARIAVHRCSSPDWTAVVFELYVEPTAVFRAALMGSDGIVNKHTEVLGLAHIELESIGSLDSELWVKLLRCGGYASESPDGISICIRVVRERQSTPEGAITTRVVVSKAKLPRSRANGDAVLVRVIAFKEREDARSHVQDRRSCKNEPLPTGRACAQVTGPGRPCQEGLVWDASLEFIGLGADASVAQMRLQEMVPDCFQAANVSRIVHESLWPDLLPPPFLSVQEAKDYSLVWSQQLVPWLRETGGHPAHWLPAEPYTAGEEVQCYSVSAKAWLTARVLEVELVELRYDGPDGPMTKQLPLRHEHLRLAKPEAKGQEASRHLRVGDNVLCYSASQNRWIEAVVLETDLVSVRYEGKDGPVNKQLPACHEHLRHLPKAVSGSFLQAEGIGATPRTWPFPGGSMQWDSGSMVNAATMEAHDEEEQPPQKLVHLNDFLM